MCLGGIAKRAWKRAEHLPANFPLSFETCNIEILMRTHKLWFLFPEKHKVDYSYSSDRFM